MSRIIERVQEEILAGELGFFEIAEKFNMALEDVQDIADELYSDEADPGSMDGDHETALASVGWGTDEDYAGWEDIEF